MLTIDSEAVACLSTCRQAQVSGHKYLSRIVIAMKIGFGASLAPCHDYAEHALWNSSFHPLRRVDSSNQKVAFASLPVACY
jgi:hypothetical protein